MINVRKSVFETNSSSTHSITVADNGSLKNNLKCYDGFIQMQCGEFGWEYRVFDDAYTKLSYLITFIFSGFVKKDTDEIDWRKFNKPDNKHKHYWHKLIEAVRDFTDCEPAVVPVEEDWWPYGYIDHQSMNVAEEILKGSKGRIKRFIFNPHSKLIIDNDNREDYFTED